MKQVFNEKLIPDELDVRRQLNDCKSVPAFYACIIGDSRKYVYLVQELIGKNFAHYEVGQKIRQKSRLMTLHFFHTGFYTVREIYNAGLIHNDINPNHLLSDRNVNKIFLIGFGMAKKLQLNIPKKLTDTPY